MGYNSRTSVSQEHKSEGAAQVQVQAQAQAHQNWTDQDWKDVTWSDEFQFLLRQQTVGQNMALTA